MAQFAIRCHPSVPVSVADLERFFERQAKDLRAHVPHGTVRLSRLTQRLASGNVDIGWLLELEVSGRGLPRVENHLADALRELRLLGLQPTLLRRTSPP